MKTIILAIDWGERRLGIALSDDRRIMAHPYGIIENGDAVYEKIGELTHEREVGLVLIGLPLTLAGEEGNMAIKVREFGHTLSRLLPDIPIEYFDERLTSSAAEKALITSGKKAKNSKNYLDAVAAALLLETYLELTKNQDTESETDS